MRSIFTGAKKCGGAKRHKGRSSALAHARLPFCVARAAEGGEAYTDLLSAGFALANIFYHFL